MKCEKCQGEHEGKYGSGRFCSSFCSRGFSTKEKRSLINDKLKITNPKKIKDFKDCSFCGNKFEKLRGKKYCSKLCSDKSQKGRPKIGNYSNNGGMREGGGRSKQLSYVNWLNDSMKLNKEEIEVAKILDILKLNWNRNNKGFRYLTKDNKLRKFYPDFYIKDLDLYLEYKGWLTDEMRHKMKDCLDRNDIKLLIVVGKDSRYVNDGISIEELSNYIQIGVAQ